MSVRKLLVPSLLLGLAACSPDLLPADAVFVAPDAVATPDALVQDAFVVRLAPATTLSALDTPFERIAARDVRAAGGANTYTFRSERSASDVRAELELDDDVLWVEPVVRVEALGFPNDPYYGYQWHMEVLRLPDARDLGTGRSVVVAIVDTGVKAHNDGFSALEVGWNAVTDTPDGRGDGNGHGTHVAGTVAQATDNGVGVAGMASGVTILPVKVLDDAGSGTSVDVAEGIRWAADHGAQVINMSLGAGVPMAVVEDACAYAASKGVLIVAAAGNDYGGPVSWPAAYETVIAVGATDFTAGLAFYSNVGPEVELVAPGGDTWADLNGDGYGDGVLQETICAGSPCYSFYMGTSMAAPHVAGAAALLFGAGAPDAATVRALLASTATDLGATGRDEAFGYGIIDPVAAMLAIGDTPPDCAADRCVDDLSPGDLVITEVMADPSVCSDTTGEWIEIYNATDGTIDLTGLGVRDRDGNSGTVSATRHLQVGEHAVLGRRAAGSFCGPAAIGHYGSSVTLNNTADQVFLDGRTTLSASLAWTAALRGTSYELDPYGYEAPTADDWAASTTPQGNGEKATPNAASGPMPGPECEQPPAPAPTAPCDRAQALCVDELAQGDVTITELMIDPTAGSDYCAEWIEIANHTEATVDLAGLVLRDNTGTATVTGPVRIAAGDRAVLGKGSASKWCHPDVQPDGWFGTVTLNNSNESITLEFAGFRIDDSVYWGAVRPGVSLERLEAEVCAADEDPSAWTDATTPYGSRGEKGTPGY